MTERASYLWPFFQDQNLTLTPLALMLSGVALAVWAVFAARREYKRAVRLETAGARELICMISRERKIAPVSRQENGTRADTANIERATAV